MFSVRFSVGSSVGSSRRVPRKQVLSPSGRAPHANPSAGARGASAASAPGSIASGRGVGALAMDAAASQRAVPRGGDDARVRHSREFRGGGRRRRRVDVEKEGVVLACETRKRGGDAR